MFEQNGKARTGSQASMGSRNSQNYKGLDDESFAKLVENRSMYGSYLDNALAYDPNKDKRPVYDVIYTQEIYDPWGKPGGGAPLFNRDNGKLKTKLEGTMQWNLDGSTLSAKSRQRKQISKQMLNAGEFKRSNPTTPKGSYAPDVTTYREVFGGIDNSMQLPKDVRHKSSERNLPDTNLEREAEMRNLSRKTARDMPNMSYFSETNMRDPPNYSKLWFSRPGGGAPTWDNRRKKLYDQLENRNNQKDSEYSSIADYYRQQSLRSSHKNLYDGINY